MNKHYLFFISLFAFLLPNSSFAVSEPQTDTADCATRQSYLEPLSPSHPYCIASVDSRIGQANGRPYTYRYYTTTNGTYDRYWWSFTIWDDYQGEEVSSPYQGLDGYVSPIVNAEYSDAQCESNYGGSQIFQTNADQAEAGFTTAGGACGVAAVSTSIACWDSSDGNEYCSADWVSVSSGEPASLDTGDSSGTVSDFTPPDYMTPNESCTGNCVTIDGQTYEVDQDAIDNGTVTIVGGDSGSDDGGDSGSGIDYGDGSGTPTPGTSTDADGDPLGMGQGEGDSTLGDIVGAINGLKSSIQNGFDGVVDSLSNSFNDSLNEFGEDLTDTEGMPTDGEIDGDVDAAFDGEGTADDIMENLENQYQETNTDLEQQYEEAFNESSPLSNTLSTFESIVTSYLPSLPSGSCSPLQFESNAASFTIDCDGFNILKSCLSFVMFFFTAFEITSIALSYRNSA